MAKRRAENEPLRVNPGDMIIRADIATLRTAADTVVNGIINEGVERIIIGEHIPGNSQLRPLGNALAIGFALDLRNGIYTIQTSRHLRRFFLKADNVPGFSHLDLIKKHLLPSEQRPVQLLESATIQQTLIPDLLWVEYNAELFAVTGRGHYPGINQYFRKQLTLPRNPQT